MRIIFNFSNLRRGGSIQVAHSVITELSKYKHNEYLLIVSDEVQRAISELPQEDHIEIRNLTIFFKDKIKNRKHPLDKLEEEFKPDIVYTLFGPAYWRPKVPHITGFARGHYIYKDSPFYQQVGLKEKLTLLMHERMHMYLFKKESDAIVSETEDVRDRAGALLNLPAFFASNTYNKVFDQVNGFDQKVGTTFNLLFVAAAYSHKNHKIIPLVIDELLQIDKDFDFKFILSINEEELPNIEPYHQPYIDFIGSVKIADLPALYQNADAMFLPTLLECFSASYAEAMKMKVPIITSNLSFAKSICSDAAAYFEPTEPKDIAQTIYRVYSDECFRNTLVENGSARLSHFLSAAQRVSKYHEIMEEVLEQHG